MADLSLSGLQSGLASQRQAVLRRVPLVELLVRDEGLDFI